MLHPTAIAAVADLLSNRFVNKFQEAKITWFTTKNPSFETWILGV